MRAAVFAAGLGKRLRPLTNVRPKHLLPLAGKPVLRRILEALEDVGIRETVILVSYLSELIRDSVESWNLNLDTVFVEQEEILGTGHALKMCRPYLTGGRFLVAYGDITLTSRALRSLIEFHEKRNGDGVVEAVEVEDVSRYGAIMNKDNLFMGVMEKSAKGPGLANAGLYILPEESLELVDRIRKSPRGEYELTDLLNMLRSKGYRLLVHRSRGDWWFDIGRPTDYLKANLVIMQREEVKFMEKGSRVLGRTMPPYFIGHGTYIGEGAEIRCGTTVMEDVVVGRESVVEESILLSGCHVGSRCRLRRVIVGYNAVIEDEVEIMGGEEAAVVAPNSTIRSGTSIKGGGVYP